MPITVASSWFLQTIGAILLGVLPVSVDTNAGKTIQGDLAGFSTEAVLLIQSGEVVTLSFDDIYTLRPDAVEEKTGPGVQITLLGGSRIFVREVKLDQDGLKVQPSRQKPLRVPVKRVKSIRFRKPSVSTDAQWLGLVERENRGDTLVIRRPGNRLDPQQGVVLSIADGKVEFDLDGTTIQAPIDRLEGLVFGGGTSVSEDAAIQVTDAWGSRWAVRSLQQSGGDAPIRLQLGNSLGHELPLSQIVSIQWSGGMSLLANTKPAASSFQSYIKTQLNPSLLDGFFGPRGDGDADLTMHGGSVVEYRIEPGFRVLAGSVRRDRDVAKSSDVTVRIELDGETVWEESLKDNEPRGFELPVNDSRRLAIHVDDSGDGDLGDTVRISRPRLIK